MYLLMVKALYTVDSNLSNLALFEIEVTLCRLYIQGVDTHIQMITA